MLLPPHLRQHLRQHLRPAWARWAARLPAWLRPRPAPTPERQRARELVAAVDAGGVPLNPARVNAIARSLGLEVARSAPVEATIERIRAALDRA